MAVLALIGIAIWFGYRSGFVATAYSLASWILALTAGIAFQSFAAGLVEAVVGLPRQVAASVGFIAVIVVAEAIFSLLGFLAIRPLVALVRRGPLDRPDRVLGMVPAVLRSFIVVAVAVLGILALPFSSETKAAVEASRTGRIVTAQFAAFSRQIASLTGQIGGSPLLVTRVGEDETERLVLPDDLDLAADPVAELQLLDLVNDERAQHALPALALDERLVPVARAHSEEMFKLKYFSHESPTTGSPFDRLRSSGIEYTRAGENLAYAQSVAVAHRALMDSPGHRENVLRPEFTRVGIGIISAGIYGRMFTQLFVTP
jgi:uncharacterized protein YkwD